MFEKVRYGRRGRGDRRSCVIFFANAIALIAIVNGVNDEED